MTLITDDILNELLTIQSDQALTNRFMARNPQFINCIRAMLEATGPSKVRPLPGTAPLNAVEVSIYDNWPAGKRVKSKPNRYGFSLNASDAVKPDPLSWEYHFSGSLVSGDDLKERVTALQKPKLRNPISNDFREFAHTLVDVHEDISLDYRFGLLQAKPHGEGTVYPDSHVLVVQLDPQSTRYSVADANLFVGMDCMPLAPFVRSFAGGKGLTSNVILQSRSARGTGMAGWQSD